MRIQSTTVGSATNSPWLPVDYKQKSFSIGLGCTITSGASLTYKVQYTFDDLGLELPFYATRTTTTATAKVADHGLSVGDSIRVTQAGAPFDGTYDVASVVDANTFTFTVANSGAATSLPGAQIVVMRVFDHDVLVSKTTKASSNYAFPITATRLVCTAYTSGKVTLTAVQGV